MYCLTPGECGIPASAIGVDGKPGVMIRACGGIGAVLSQVELEEFCGESADARLQDLAWLGPAANGSDSPDTSDGQRKKDVALLALEAVFAQYGR